MCELFSDWNCSNLQPIPSVGQVMGCSPCSDTSLGCTSVVHVGPQGCWYLLCVERLHHSPFSYAALEIFTDAVWELPHPSSDIFGALLNEWHSAGFWKSLRHELKSTPLQCCFPFLWAAQQLLQYSAWFHFACLHMHAYQLGAILRHA